METDPPSIDPTYWPSPCGTPPCGPRGFAMDVNPLPLSTYNCLPSLLNSTPVGYQPAGTKPMTRLLSSFEISTSATELLSAFATASCLPSGETASALGVAP